MEVKPITEFTKEIINDLVIHSTRGGLVRSTAINGCTIVSESDNLPTLYYEIDKDKQIIHAITGDIIKFLLKKSI